MKNKGLILVITLSIIIGLTLIFKIIDNNTFIISTLLILIIGFLDDIYVKLNKDENNNTKQ